MLLLQFQIRWPEPCCWWGHWSSWKRSLPRLQWKRPVRDPKDLQRPSDKLREDLKLSWSCFSRDFHSRSWARGGGMGRLWEWAKDSFAARKGPQWPSRRYGWPSYKPTRWPSWQSLGYFACGSTPTNTTEPRLWFAMSKLEETYYFHPVNCFWS